jgi:hypothetical protein
MATPKTTDETSEPAPEPTAPEPVKTDDLGGPSSHDTCGQFPADEVAGG